MKQIQNIPWLRIGAESVAIVASILLAFAVDAWWAERVDRRSQVEELSQLYDEFIDVRERLSEESREESVAAVTRLLELMQEHPNRNEPLAVPNEILLRTIHWGNFDLATPVLDGIILSGRLDRFQSPRLSAAIFDWRIEFSEIQRNELLSRGQIQQHLLPALMSRGNMAGVLTLSPRDPKIQGTTALVVDDEIEGYVAMRWRIVSGDHRRLERLRPLVDELLEAILEARGR